MSSVASAGVEAGKSTVFITGANRGIGLEFVRQFAAQDWNVIATARKPAEADELQALAQAHDHVVVEQLDVTDYARIDALAEKYREQPIDVLLSNAAITPRDPSQFKRLSGVDFDLARQSFEVNALAPLRVIHAFMDHVVASEQKKIIAMSSRAGSFAESPQMAMMYAYRGSKAALNMYIYTLSFETAKKGITAVALSPGTVNTTPGFKMPQGQEPAESVEKMLEVIAGLSSADNGKFIDHETGGVIPW